MFQTKKDFITCSKLMINELARSSTRSENVYFANNEQALLQSLLLCFALDMSNII